MRQEQQQRGQPQKREFPPRFLWVVLMLLASLAAIYFYVIPFLSSMAGGSTGSAFSGGWSVSQQRQIAFSLAQTVQSYRQRIHEQRRINYGDAAPTGGPTWSASQ